MMLRRGAKIFRRGDETREEDISTPNSFDPVTATVSLVVRFYQQLSLALSHLLSLRNLFLLLPLWFTLSRGVIRNADEET